MYHSTADERDFVRGMEEDSDDERELRTLLFEQLNYDAHEDLVLAISRLRSRLPDLRGFVTGLCQKLPHQVREEPFATEAADGPW